MLGAWGDRGRGGAVGALPATRRGRRGRPGRPAFAGGPAGGGGGRAAGATVWRSHLARGVPRSPRAAPAQPRPATELAGREREDEPIPSGCPPAPEAGEAGRGRPPARSPPRASADLARLSAPLGDARLQWAHLNLQVHRCTASHAAALRGGRASTEQLDAPAPRPRPDSGAHLNSTCAGPSSLPGIAAGRQGPAGHQAQAAGVPGA